MGVKKKSMLIPHVQRIPSWEGERKETFADLLELHVWCIPAQKIENVPWNFSPGFTTDWRKLYVTNKRTCLVLCLQ